MNMDLNYNKQDDIITNSGYYVIPADQDFSLYQIQLENKVQQEGQEIVDVYGNQSNLIEYISKQFQYQQQNSIQNNISSQEPLKQMYYNLQNQNAYQVIMNPQLLNQQIGLINSYDSEQIQPNQDNNFDQYQINEYINIPDTNIIIQQDNNSKVQQIFNYNNQISPNITIEYQGKTKTKKQRNSSNKNIQNTAEVKNDIEGNKKGKKQNKRSQEKILIENINYNNIAKEQADSSLDEEQNNINNQAIQIANISEKTINQNVDTNDIQTPKLFARQSFSQQYSKSQIDSNLFKQESYNTIIGTNSCTNLPILQQNETYQSNNYIDIKQNTEQLNEEQVLNISNEEHVSLENNDQIQNDFQINVVQSPEQAGTKRKYTKKNNQDKNQPPKKQREKKQKGSNTIISTQTTISIIPQMHVDYPTNKNEEENNFNDNNSQIKISQQELILDKDISSQNDQQQINLNDQHPSYFQNNGSLQQIQNEDILQVLPIKKRQSTKRVSKKSIKAEKDLIQEEIINQDQEQNDLHNNNDYNKILARVDQSQLQEFQPIQPSQIWNNSQLDQQQDNCSEFQYDYNNNLNFNQSSNQNEQQIINKNEKLNYEQINYSQINQNINNDIDNNQQQKQLQLKINEGFNQNDFFNEEDKKQIYQIQNKSEPLVLKKKKSSKKRKDLSLEAEENKSLANKIDFEIVRINEQQLNDQDQIDIEYNGVEVNNEEIQLNFQPQEQQQYVPEEILQIPTTKKRSSVSSGCKKYNRKRKIDCILSENENINKSSNSENEDQVQNNQLVLSKEKSIHEKKRGLRDLTNEEKWDVYVQYNNLNSYRGVGRIFNMDHSTVKLLIQRINNERPGEEMTKELFFLSSIVQPSLEHGVSKKLKKEQKINQMNNQKCEKTSESDPNSIAKNSFENQQYQIEEQIDIYCLENNNSQQKVIDQQEQNLTTQTQPKIDSLLQINDNKQTINFESEEFLIPVITKRKSKKECKNLSGQKMTKSRSQKKNQSQVNTEEQNNLQQLTQEDKQIIQTQIEYQYNQQQNENDNNENDNLNQQQILQNLDQEENQKQINIDKMQYSENTTINDQNGYQMEKYDYNYYQQENEQQDYPQQQQNQFQTHQLSNQQNILLHNENQNNTFCDINAEEKIENEVQYSQQEIGLDQNNITQQPLQTLLRRKSSQKMTPEEKQARKEIRKQLKEQQKSSIIKEEKPKKKGKKGQIESTQIENEQQDQQENENTLNSKQSYKNSQIKGNQSPYSNYEENLQYIPEGLQNNYNLIYDNNYQDKYEEDYDINIELDINNNYSYQQQQQNQQYYENDEIKLDLM